MLPFSGGDVVRRGIGAGELYSRYSYLSATAVIHLSLFLFSPMNFSPLSVVKVKAKALIRTRYFSLKRKAIAKNSRIV